MTFEFQDSDVDEFIRQAGLPPDFPRDKVRRFMDDALETLGVKDDKPERNSPDPTDNPDPAEPLGVKDTTVATIHPPDGEPEPHLGDEPIPTSPSDEPDHPQADETGQGTADHPQAF